MEELPIDTSSMDLSGLNVSPEMLESFSWLVLGFIALMVWSMAWKGWALWRSARLNQKGWFIAMFLINTLGILEILYIFAISKDAEAKK